MTELSIRPTDEQGTSRLWTRAAADHMEYHPGTELWGAWLAGHLVGMAGIQQRGRGSFELKAAYVLPEYRHHRIHTALIDYRMDELARRHATKATARCWATSLPQFLGRGFTVRKQWTRVWLVEKELAP